MLYTSIAIYDLRIRNNPFGRVMGRKTVLVIRVLSSIGEFQLTHPRGVRLLGLLDFAGTSIDFNSRTPYRGLPDSLDTLVTM